MAWKKIDDFKLRNFAVFVCLSLFSAAVFMVNYQDIFILFFAIFFLRLFGQGLMVIHQAHQWQKYLIKIEEKHLQFHG